MANTAAPAAQRTVTVSPQDYQAFLAMLQHEAGAPILRSLNTGNLYDAMGHIASLTDVWLNRAAAQGTTPLYQMNRPYQISHWNQDTINQNAASLDPRIRQLFDAYLDNRAGTTQGVNPDISMYLNRVFMERNPGEGQGWRTWYPQSVQRDAYGDRAGGVQHEFLQLQRDYDVPLEYNVQLNGVRLNPSDYARETFSTYEAEHPAYQNRLGFTPVGGPPARPNDGSNGIEPRASDYGLPTAMSDLRNLWNSVQDGATNLSEGAQGFLRDLFAPPTIGNGPMPTEPPAAMTDGFGNTNVSKGVGPGSLAPPLTSYGPAPDPYGFGGNVSGGVGNGVTGQLPAGFDANAYLAANPDLTGPLAAMGMSAGEHYLRAGQAEGRRLTPTDAPTLNTATTVPTLTGPGPTAPTLTNTGTVAPTLDTGTTVPTLAPTVTTPTLGGGKGVPTLGPDVTVPTLTPTGTAQTTGAPSLTPTLGPTLTPTLDTGTTATTVGAPSLTPTLGPTGTPTLDTGTVVPTLGGGGVVPTLGPTDVSTIGPTNTPTLTPTTVGTIGPTTTQVATDATPTVTPPLVTPGASGGKGGVPDLPLISVNTMGPGATAPSLTGGTTVPTLAPTASATTLPPNFDPQAYLQANPDLVQPLAAMGISPGDHYLRFGMQEGRTMGAPGLTPLTPYTGTTVPTLGPTTTPTLDTATTVPTLGPSTTVTATDGPEIAFDPVAYRQANPDIGNMNPFQHFVLSGFNEGRALNPQGQTFGSSTPGFLTFDLPSLTQGLDPSFASTLMNSFSQSTGGSAIGGNGGAGISNPFGFSGMNVGGFNTNTGGGGSGGARTRSSIAAMLAAQQASRDWFDLAARPATALNYNANNQQLAQITPVVPNLTLTNLQNSYGPQRTGYLPGVNGTGGGPSFGIGGFGGIAGFA